MHHVKLVRQSLDVFRTSLLVALRQKGYPSSSPRASAPSQLLQWPKKLSLVVCKWQSSVGHGSGGTRLRVDNCSSGVSQGIGHNPVKGIYSGKCCWAGTVGFGKRAAEGRCWEPPESPIKAWPEASRLGAEGRSTVLAAQGFTELPLGFSSASDHFPSRETKLRRALPWEKMPFEALVLPDPRSDH